MAYDGIMMHQVIKELNNTITGGRINKIYQISKYELLIQIRNNRTNYKLLLSCHPMYARIQLTNLIYPTPESPNPLTMLFRKHLEGGYIKEINQIELDRICHILFGCHNEFGDYVEYHCFIEIMGKHSNIILCNENKKIIDCLKRITPNINSERFVQPGAIYYFPPVNYNKLNPFNHDFIENNNLSKVYQGMSPILSKEILFRYDNGNDFKTIMNEIKESDHLYISNTGEKEYFHLIPLTHLQVTPQIYRLFDGLDQHFDLIDQKERIKQQTSNLLKFISNEYQKNITKLSKLQATLESSKNSDEYRIIGDLLYSNLHLLKKGMKHIELDNYYDNTKIMIDLDEKLSPKANAQKYYNKYQKAKNSINVLNEQINLTKKEIEYFDSLLTLMDNASYYDAYYTKDGIEICIGKNNLQNDYLTFKHAHRYDTWFHVKDMPGSHVIVKGDQLDEYTIRLASNIAAYFSKGKNSSSVPVNYTLVKTLKKPNAAKPGQVILDKYKTIYIDPDASCLEELRKK